MVALMDEDLNCVGEKVGEVQAVPAKPVSCHLIEVDKLGNVLWSWSYPACDNEQKLVCLRKFNAAKRRHSASTEIFIYFRYRKTWFYIFVSKVLSTYDANSTKLAKLDQVGVVVEAIDFNPERYRMITEILFRTYYKQEDPNLVLQQFLSLIVGGTCQLPKKKIFCSSDYDTPSPFTDSQIKTFISKFGLESIVLLTALLRKQRIVIYDHDIDTLVKYVLSVPELGVNEDSNKWNNVYPWIGYNEDELDNFKESNFHIIGCPNAGIENRSDLYDIFVNIPAGEINVALHAKEKMMMGKPHKEMALFMVQLIEKDELDECDMVQEIRAKVKELSIHVHPAKKDATSTTVT